MLIELTEKESELLKKFISLELDKGGNQYTSLLLKIDSQIKN
ncbi:hypothetical protein [Enterococcus mundtii]|nr:hypothetical protein [Enterococcus mundtii]